jgi:hypothetical protein
VESIYVAKRQQKIEFKEGYRISAVKASNI